MTRLPDPLHTRASVLAAPMAGGPSGPDLVLAAATADSLGFLAAGYKTLEQLAGQIAEVRAATDRFGVNVFVPGAEPVDRVAYRAYRESLRPEADRFGVALPTEPREDDDQWAAKIDLLRADPVPVVSFTFALPARDVVHALQRAGSVVVQSVTTADEARASADLGVDALVVQASAAGGHSATTTPGRLPEDTPLPDLLRAVSAAVTLPLIGAGGVAVPPDVRAARAAGAAAVLVGTVLLRTPESGTSAPHREALADPTRGDTVLTRAFSGRPARALPNRFLRAHDAEAPRGYPAIHHLTSPLRKAAAAAGDPENVNLWAGAGYRAATDAAAGDVLRSLEP